VTAAPSGSDALEFVGLVRRFGEVVALDDVSFRVSAGEMVGFVGPNGAGKTTAMRIALGVLAADSGEVRWDGSPVTLDTRRQIGYMPEERGLYPKMKVGEQLVYLARLHGMSVPAANRAVAEWTERLSSLQVVWSKNPQILELFTTSWRRRNASKKVRLVTT
jgi:ABC-2 type transport system ATP-binding protein